MEQDQAKMDDDFKHGDFLADHSLKSHLGPSISTKRKYDVYKSFASDLHCYELRENPKKSWKSKRTSPNADGTPQPQRRLLKCTTSEKELGSPSSLDGQLKHPDGGEFVCSICGSSFKNNRGRNGHMRIHSERRSSGPVKKMRTKYSSSPVTALETVDLMNPPKKKRSKRIRCGNSSSSDHSSNYGSSPEFQFSHEEVEVAESLLLLSTKVFAEADLMNCSSSGRVFDSCNGSIYEGERIVTDVEGKVMGIDHEERVSAMNVDNMQVDSHSSYPSDGGKKKKGIQQKEIVKKVKKKCNQGKLKKRKIDVMASPTASGESKFKCRICNKRFASFQSLGGHQTSHRPQKKDPLCDPSPIVETQTLSHEEKPMEVKTEDHDMEEYSPEGNREYKCDLCCRIFPSGQALGGHKRAHWEKSEEEMQQSLPHLSNILAIMTPCTVPADAATEIEAKPNWSKNGYKGGSLGIIAL